ncbi:unnamed protein product [Closterium sp. NIES-64]|nr:unnamed protein product [Closterium sp. NIES-64]
MIRFRSVTAQQQNTKPPPHSSAEHNSQHPLPPQYPRPAQKLPPFAEGIPPSAQDRPLSANPPRSKPPRAPGGTHPRSLSAGGEEEAGDGEGGRVGTGSTRGGTGGDGAADLGGGGGGGIGSRRRSPARIQLGSSIDSPGNHHQQHQHQQQLQEGCKYGQGFREQHHANGNGQVPKKRPAGVPRSNSSPGKFLELPDEVLSAIVPDSLLRFSYDDVAAATNGFAPAQLIGEGGFGKVYRGSIRAELLERGERGARGGSGERGERGGTGERGEGGGERGDMDQGAMGQGGVGQGAMGQGAMVQVAVKQLREESKQGAEEFLREVLVLGRLNHAHLVLLWGYCVDGGAFLVYELMEGGSLDYALIDSAKGELHFSWPMRLKVAVEVAEALVYMHRCNFIHRDIKAANVLLKPDYSAKLTDFGMVRVGPGGQLRSIVSTRVMGTEGYIDPSYLETGHLGAKSDVYSFGVILLELLTGQRVLEKGNQLVTVCRQQFQDLALPSRLYADPKLHGEYPEVGARQLATLAKHCLAEQRHDRPDMVTVLQQLKEIVGRT